MDVLLTDDFVKALRREGVSDEFIIDMQRRLLNEATWIAPEKAKVPQAQEWIDNLARRETEGSTHPKIGATRTSGNGLLKGAAIVAGIGAIAWGAYELGRRSSWQQREQERRTTPAERIH